MEEKSFSKPKSIKQNYIYILINKFFSAFVPIIVTPYLSRILGADGNGVISYVYSYVTYFLIFCNLGIETYGQRLIAVNRDDRAKLKKILLEIFSLRLILTLISLIVYYFIFVSEFNRENNLLYGIFAFNILLVAVDFTWFFQGMERFGVLALANSVTRIVYIVTVFLFVKSKDDLSIAALLYLVNVVLPYVLSFPAVFKGIGGKMVGKFNPFSHLKPCLVYFVPTIATQIYTVLDKTMIGLITQSDFEIGYYEQVDKIVKLCLTVITALNIIMRSRISYYYEQGETEKIKGLIYKSAHILFLLSFPIMFGMIAVARSFIPIYLGEGYDKCVVLLYILAFLVPIIGTSGLYASNYYTPFDKQSMNNKFLITGAVVNVILNSFLIYLLQSVGAAIASVTAEFVITFLHVFFARSFISVGKFFKISVKYILAASVMFAVVFTVDWFLPVSVLFLILEILLGIFVYAVMLLILREKFVMGIVKEFFGKIFKRREE